MSKFADIFKTRDGKDRAFVEPGKLKWLSNMIVQQGLATREFWSSEATLVYMSN